MGRRAGARNRDYERTRHDLAVRSAGHLIRPDGEPATLTDLAAVAGVSATTMAHYFGNREGVYVAAMDAVRSDGAAYLEAMGDPGGRPPEQTLPAALLGTAVAWRTHGLGAVVAGSLAQGIAHERRGPAFLGGVLEPLLAALERLLAAHVRDGDLPAHDTRLTALSLLSPVVLALLHQDALGGTDLRPLDVDHLARAHAALVLAGLRASDGPSPAS